MRKKFNQSVKEYPNWVLNPSYMCKVVYDNKFYLYIDESGNSNNKHLKTIKEHMNDPNSDYMEPIDEAFSLTGILINGKELKKLDEKFTALKRKSFGTEFMSDGRAIVIHRKDFGYKVPFKKVNNFDKKKFELAIENILSDIDFKVFSICNNKLVAYSVGKLDLDLQGFDHKIYEHALDQLMKQVYTQVHTIRKKVVCVFEGVNEKHNSKIHRYIVENRDKEHFQIIKNVMFSSKAIDCKAVVGLEVADYFSMASFRWALSRDYLRITKKYNNFPNHYGNGVKIYAKSQG